MEKTQIAIAVPNRSLILTVLNHTSIVGPWRLFSL